ncbi:MAG: hypothetical protein LBC70_01785, partial [Chitinispirillales bacterium]|nr:hypothetical protein [Chitinispirillales bacterium]
ALSFGNTYAQHFFSVNYNELSREDAKRVKEQVIRSSVLPAPLTRGTNGEYGISFSTVQNTKIIILNEKTGNNVVITPTKETPAQFRLQPFFIEELRRSFLGDAESYLMIEAGTDFSVRNAASFSLQAEEVFIPRYFYGPKEDVKEALPEDRQIIHIFKEKPRLIPAFPDDPENLRYVAWLEEEMSYYVYMYKLPDGTLIIYDEHFNPNTERNGTTTSRSGNLQFNLSGNLNTQQQVATLHAIDLWSAELAGTIPIDINIMFVNMGPGVLGGSYRQPHYWNPTTQTWYSSALGNQLAGYNVVPGMRDIRLEMNSIFNWNFSITTPPSGSQFDWITIMLHEITHGLGFSTLVGSNGGYVYTTSGGTSANTDFPGIFDRQLYQGILGANLPDLNQSQRAALVVSNNLFSGRPDSYLLAANGGTRVRMHAPTTWSSGSSVTHWDNSVTFPTFMKFSASQGFRLHTINEREIAIMRDMGWAFCSPIINFTNQTVTTNTAVTNGCGAINVQNVTVTPTGTLNIRASDRVIIGPGFTVQPGGSFTIQAP